MKKILPLLLLLLLPFALHATVSEVIHPDKYYTITSKKDAKIFLCENNDGGVIVCPYDVTQRIFWQFIPTGKPNCYYIRNAASGHYVASCNGPQSPNSRIKVTSTPVEYYIGEDGQHFRFTSTDCKNYDNTALSPNGLNKEGSSSNVIIWKAGKPNGFSWWDVHETQNLYEVKPFKASPAVGHPMAKYLIKNANKGNLSIINGALTWTHGDETATAQWYFVGESNAQGGYQLVNVSTQKPYQEGVTYKVMPDAAGGYHFVNATNDEVLTIDGTANVTFVEVRSMFSKVMQLYNLPCGAVTDNYITEVRLQGEAVRQPLIYPLHRIQDGRLTTASTQPNSWYTLYTHSQATLMPGKAVELSLNLLRTPQAGDSLYVYFDWNRDGVFETAYHLHSAQQNAQTFQVPTDAKQGKTRMRVRFTCNGLTQPEEDVAGQTMDFILNVIPDTDAPYTIKVFANDTIRGKVSVENHTAIATPVGDGTFIGWKEGNNWVSLSPEFTFTLDHDMVLQAFFSPNSEERKTLNIENVAHSQWQVLDITSDRTEVFVHTQEKTCKIYVYNMQGKLVQQGEGTYLRLKKLAPGTYIVRAVTEKQKKAEKVILN